MKPKWTIEAEAALDAYMARREDLINRLSAILPTGHPLKPANASLEHRRVADQEAA